MWWQAETQALSRVADRVSTVYVDYAVVGRENNAIVLLDADGAVHVPAAMVAALLMGPGTKITHAAVRLLADSGTTVCWVGEQGVRMYAHGVSTATHSHLLLRQAYLVSDVRRRLGVARRMYEMRFPGEDTARLTMQQLRGREGARVKRVYREQSERTGVEWRGRQYVPGQAMAAGDPVNRLLSALNTCLYGVAHAAIVGVGASAGLGFVHTGSSISFTLDIADLYKAEATIPAAFDLAALGATSERAARTHFRSVVTELRLVPRIVADVRALLGEGGDGGVDELASAGQDRLVDAAGELPGGINRWADWDLPA